METLINLAWLNLLVFLVFWYKNFYSLHVGNFGANVLKISPSNVVEICYLHTSTRIMVSKCSSDKVYDI
jgi:hypothetical protein